MDQEEKNYIAQAINYFWGPNVRIAPEDVTPELAEIAYDAMERSGACSLMMNYVPRPSGIGGGIGYSVKQLIEIGKRVMSGDTERYYVCKQIVKVTGRSAIELAIRGR